MDARFEIVSQGPNYAEIHCTLCGNDWGVPGDSPEEITAGIEESTAVHITACPGGKA